LAKNGMRPIHPGEILRDDVLAELGMSANAFARELKVPSNRITAILNGERSITADTALRIARYLNTSAQFWMSLQAEYDLRTAEQSAGVTISKEIRPREVRPA
jgi:antitoxin HigA-1